MGDIIENNAIRVQIYVQTSWLFGMFEHKKNWRFVWNMRYKSLSFSSQISSFF